MSKTRTVKHGDYKLKLEKNGTIMIELRGIHIGMLGHELAIVRGFNIEIDNGGSLPRAVAHVGKI
jgi:hypothetical protein